MKRPELTSRERMLLTLRGQEADRIPVAPDISNMVPCRLTAKPFWEIYLYQNPSLTMAYIDAVKYYGMDGWLVDGGVTFELNSPVEVASRTLSRSAEEIVVRNTYHTPDGDLTETVHYSAGNPPSWTEKLVKDLPSDFKKIRHLFSGIKSYDAVFLETIRKTYGDLGLYSAMVVPPGFQTFVHYFNDNLEGCVYSYCDYKDIFLELSDLFYRQEMQKLQIFLECGHEAILIGASGSVTLQSPDLWDELTLPFVQEATRMCRQAGALSGMHSCGLSQHLLRRVAEQTELNYINPLELPPMGDCELADVKARYGDRLSLMGNLHTTSVMLSPHWEKVYLESLRAIRDAGKGGGFVLSTGDQCGRDTPDANILAMLRASRDFGNYPLDVEQLEAKIQQLEKEETIRALIS